MSVDLVRTLRAVPPFDSVPLDALRDLAPSFKSVRVRAGRTLVKQGSKGRDLIVVLRGSLSVTVEERGNGAPVVSRLGPKSVVGEIALVAGGRRTATVRAVRDAHVAILPAARYRALLDEHPALAALLEAEAHRRLLQSQVPAIVAQAFGTTDTALRRDVEELAEWVACPAGDVLFEQDEEADAAYLVVFGRIGLATRDERGAETIFDEAGRGEMIGVAALDGGTRTATACAVRDSTVLRVSTKAFAVLAERHPAAVVALMQAQLARMRAPSGRRRDARHRTIAVVGGSSRVDVRLFTTRLVEELSRYGSTAHVWSSRLDTMLHRQGIAQVTSGPAQVTLTRRLFEIEEANRFVVFEADDHWSAWTQRAVRQADRVVVLADAAAPEPGEVERALDAALGEGRRPRLSLVLLHAGLAAPRGTRDALAARRVDDHYHVRLPVPADFERLGRTLAGRAVALVLGGGGARGFAHLGMFRVLAELGVPIDLVAGSSIGAVMATAPALHMSVDEMTTLSKERFAKLLDYTLPSVAVLKGKRISASIASQFKGVDIEDLWLPYFCMTTNLTRIGADVHRRGDMVRALRASVAIPGVLPPVVIDGDFHTDGGVLNNLPVDEMRRLYPECTLIAVDVAPPAGPPSKFDHGLWVSGWSAIWNKIRRRKGWRVPGIADILVRASVAGSTRDRNRMLEDGLADLYVSLDLRGVSPLEFDAVEAVAQRGYEQALPIVRDWLEENADRFGLGIHGGAHAAAHLA